MLKFAFAFAVATVMSLGCGLGETMEEDIPGDISKAAWSVIAASVLSIANILIGIRQKWFDRRDAGWDRDIKNWREIADSAWFEREISKDETIQRQTGSPDIRVRRTRDKEHKGQALFSYFASNRLSLRQARMDRGEEFSSIHDFLDSKTFAWFGVLSHDYLLHYFVSLDGLLKQVDKRWLPRTKRLWAGQIVSRLSLSEAIVLQAFALSDSDLARSLKCHIEKYGLLHKLPENFIAVQEAPLSGKFGDERGPSRINYREIYDKSAYEEM